MANIYPIFLSGIRKRVYNPSTDLIPLENYLNAVDQKAQNTEGGSFTSGAWRTRDLNTLRHNTISGASLAANRITLPAGKYICQFCAPAYATSVNTLHQTRLRNITAGTDLIIGSSARGAAQTLSVGAGHFTLTVTSLIELQHIIGTTRNTDGFGKAANFTSEIYGQVSIWRVSN